MKKGFTLVELLAVIVILAVIALITTPLILGVIEKAKKGAFQDSVLSAFDAIEYYMIEQELTEFPKEGIEVKKLKLKNNHFKYGSFVPNAEGIIEAMNISDGKYCAQGTENDLKISNGDCAIELPKAEITVKNKVATIKLSDHFGITGYAVTESEPQEWVEIEPTKSLTIEWTAEHGGNYMVYIKGLYGRTNHIEFNIKESAFCAYNPGDVIKTFNYSTTEQTLEVPCYGIYKIEAAGSGSSAAGTLVTGYISLTNEDKLYVHAGSEGGGSARTEYGCTAAPGGGATVIWLNYSSSNTEPIMVAGGGPGIGKARDGVQSLGDAYNIGSLSVTPSSNETRYRGSGSNYYNWSAGSDNHMNVVVTGAGGGGYYGGKSATCVVNGTNNYGTNTYWCGGASTTSYAGTSFIDLEKVFNYDESSQTKGNIEYTGTSGNADFRSDNIKYGAVSGNGYARLTLISVGE